MTTSKKRSGGADVILSAFLECRASLARAVRRIVRYDVDDILHDAYVRSFEAASRQSIRNPRAFLLRTATNLALNHVTRAAYQRNSGIEDLEDEIVDEGVSVEERLDSDKRFLDFCRAVGQLPEQCRRAFVLMKVYGLSQQDIAARLGISESTVEKHVAKGLLMCRSYIKNRERAAQEGESRPETPRPDNETGR